MTVLLPEGVALGQACCAGGGAYQPARLKLHEDLLVGVAVKASDQIGTAFPDCIILPSAVNTLFTLG